jgi:hypothetical protein
MRMNGSASGAAATADRWSDLDLLVIATDPAGAAEDLAHRIENHVESVFAVPPESTDGIRPNSEPCGARGC